MEYHLKTLGFTSQERVIRALGNEIWEALCDNLPAPKFVLKEAIEVIIREFGYSARTASLYARAVIKNVMAESPRMVLVKRGKYYYWV